MLIGEFFCERGVAWRGFRARLVRSQKVVSAPAQSLATRVARPRRVNASSISIAVVPNQTSDLLLTRRKNIDQMFA